MFWTLLISFSLMGIGFVLCLVIMTIYNLSPFSLPLLLLFMVVLTIMTVAFQVPYWSLLLSIPLLFALWIATAAITSAYVKRFLKRKGATVEGYITNLQVLVSRGGRAPSGGGSIQPGESFKLKCRYKYNGKPYVLVQLVKQEIYRTLHIGDRVGVPCLPNHPSIAILLVDL